MSIDENKITTTNDIEESGFESIKHIDENGNEYWYARELMPLLEYNKWQNLHNVIKMAKEACKLSNHNVFNQFTEVSKLIIGGKGNKQNVVDYKLSRYACYLIAQNADSRKKVIALAQTYSILNIVKQKHKIKIVHEIYNDKIISFFQKCCIFSINIVYYLMRCA